MIYSVWNYGSQRYDYFEGPGEVPPYGWFRRPTPGALRQPEEIAARLPQGAVYTGSGSLARGVIATDLPGVGTADTSRPGSGAGAGLAGVAAPKASDVGVDDPWESPDSRGGVR